MTNPLDGNGVALEPCPFCGSSPRIQEHDDGSYEIGCPSNWFGGDQKCNIGPAATGVTMAEAIAAWNLRSPAPSQTAVEPVASSVLGDENDLNSVAHALDIGGIGTPYRAYQGSLYCDYQPHRIADFQDYGLALAATVLFNNAKAIKAALSTLTAQAAALVAAESNAERMERNWRTAAALVERHEATIEVQSNKLIAAESEAATIKARVAELEAGRKSERESIARMLTERARLARTVIETDCEPEAQIFEMLAREILSNEQAGK